MKKIIKYLLFICLLFTGCTSGDYYNKIFKKNDIILEYSVIEDLDFEHKAYDIFLIENTEVFKENILSEYNIGIYNDLFFKEYFIILVNFKCNAMESTGGINLEYVVKRENNIEIFISVQNEYLDEVMVNKYFAIRLSKRYIEEIENINISAFKRANGELGSKYYITK